MCGLVAMIALGGSRVDTDAVEAMSEVLTHRGPDDRGSYSDGWVGLGFRRLAILDLAPTGHQPMISADGQLVLVFNGEIYNYIELRRELEALGHTFRSTGDSEVLLAAYRQWGRDCLARFNGMWAFLIYDRGEDLVFGSRDRFGVKPLYWYRTKDAIYFASEIKAIRASGRYESKPDWRLVASFLLDPQLEMLDTGTRTFYAGIEEVAAGSAFTLGRDGRMTGWRYWSLPEQAHPPADPPAAFFEVFADSVRLRMRSDVPAGISLSGGLDSTAIICRMAELRGRGEATSLEGGLQAFSYVTRDFDETAYIAETIKRTAACLHPVPVDPVRLWDNLDRVLWYQDEPVHSWSVLIGFDIFALAAGSGITVMLHGGGADETLAGYFSYFPIYWRALCRTGRTREARAEIEAYCRTHGGDAAALYRDTIRRAYRSRLWHLPGYGRLAALRRRHALRKTTWFTGEIRDAAKFDHGGPANQSLDASLRKSVERTPLPYYLRVDDRNSMASSVELRSPFLDYRLVSLAFQLPTDWKLRGPSNKYVLREAMRGRIPELVRARPDKMGFPVPVRQWVSGPLYERLQDMLASRELHERGFYRVDAIRRDLERHKAGEGNVSSGLLAIAQIECWLKQQRNDKSGYR
jgi:asparagine synthase (glutamine-hydrolysing)